MLVPIVTVSVRDELNVWRPAQAFYWSGTASIYATVDMWVNPRPYTWDQIEPMTWGNVKRGFWINIRMED